MKNTKKGFTIVELVVVISVIAILAAVLIPTFSTVIERANISSALQEAKIAMDMVSLEENADLEDGKYYIVGEKYYFTYTVASGEGAWVMDGDKEKSVKISGIMDTEKIDLTKIDSKAAEVKAVYGKTASLPTGMDLSKVIGAGTAPTDVTKTNTDISSKVIVIFVAEKAA